MEANSSPSFDGGGYDGFDFSQAELELTGSGVGNFLTEDVFPESWASGESDEFFPNTFPESWVTGELPAEDQPGDLFFPDIWREEVEPTIKGEVVFADTFPEYWLFGPSISSEAQLEKTTEVPPELVRAINEIGSMTLRRFVSVSGEAVRLEGPFYPYLDTKLGSYTANDLAIAGLSRFGYGQMPDKATDNETAAYRNHMELVWDENAASYVLAWHSPNDDPLLQDLLYAVKNELEISGGWILSYESNSLLIYPVGEERRDSEIIDIINSAIEEVYKIPAGPVIETDISYSL